MVRCSVCPSVVCLSVTFCMVRRRGSTMVPLDRALVSSYRLSIVTMSLTAAVWPQFATQVFRGGIRCLTCIGSYVNKQVTTFTFRAQAIFVPHISLDWSFYDCSSPELAGLSPPASGLKRGLRRPFPDLGRLLAGLPRLPPCLYPSLQGVDLAACRLPRQAAAPCPSKLIGWEPWLDCRL